MNENRPLVLQVITRMNVGGPARHVMALRSALSDRFRIRVVGGQEDADEGSFITPSDIFIPELHRAIRPLDELKAYRKLVVLFRELSPDIVHTHTSKAGVLGRLAARRAKVPALVHTFHGHVLEEYFGRVSSAAIAFTETSLARRTDALVAVSESVKSSLVQRGIGKGARWDVLPLTLDLTEISQSSLSRQEARRALGWPAGPPIVALIGRLAPIKDHETFLAAASEVKRRHPTCMFAVVGGGERRRWVHNQARRVLGDSALLETWIFDLAALYRAVDIVTLTSRNEGTPVALIEAGAAGLPVVATDVGGVRDVVLDGTTGILTESGNVVQIAEAISNLLSDPQLSSRLGGAARTWIEERHGTERLRAEMTELYEEVIRASSYMRNLSDRG